MVQELTRLERERERHRREILLAALSLFARKGFDQTTMAEIAEQAEFAVGTLYKFFTNKQTLYRALILDTVRGYADSLLEALRSPGTEIEKLNRYIERKAELIVRNIPTARLYFAQTAGSKLAPTAGLDDEAAEICNDVLSELETVLDAGMDKGLLLRADPRMLTVGLEGIGNAFLAN